MTTLSELPNEMLLEISGHIDYPNLNAFTQVSRHFHALSNKGLYRAIAKDTPGKAITWVAEKGKETSARKLLQMCGLKILDDLVFEGQEPIVIAASNGHTNLVELFLPHCIQHDTKKEGEDLFKRALTVAIPEKHVAVVKLLLEHKTDFKTNHEDRHAAIPLCKAVEMGHVSIVKLFLEHNYCNLDTYDLDGMTPVALAAAMKASSANLEIAQLLVEAGADLYRDDNLLLKTAKSDNLPVMKLFLANNLCWRRLEWSEVLREFSRLRRKNHEMGSLLLSWIDVDRILKISNIQRCYLLRGAIANRLDDLLEKILDESAVLDEDHKVNRKGIYLCPLSLVVCYGQPRAVKLLLDHGADPSGEGDCRPVQFALEKGKDTMARLLFDKGARFDPEKCRGSAEYRQLMKLRMARVQRKPIN
ncbi:hypothetical protein N7449_001599 [Penicillium cf. viridicatum]|uniref:F-box domain-containing protein n=1 Tax=Penicillium cf. viridicatum TaxID=2972119 RepID=A0A9W9TAE9_9EURO|nr:hypothetical protein N7449_001599 [Penicillium cf. viridicatum]